MLRFSIICASILILSACTSDKPTVEQAQTNQEPTPMLSEVKTNDGEVLYTEHPVYTEQEIAELIETDAPEGTVRCGDSHYNADEVLEQKEGKILFAFADGPEWIECDPNATLELD